MKVIDRYKKQDVWPKTTKFEKESFDHLQDIMINANISLINKFKNLIIFNYLNYYFYVKKIKKNKLKKKLKKNIYPKNI